jgi:hypothetical protein
MIIFQIIMLIGFALYIIFNSINFMDTYSREAIMNFNENRKIKIIGALILFLLIYFSGGFNLIF